MSWLNKNAAFWYMHNTHSNKQVLPTKIFFSANFFMPDSLSTSVPFYTDCILNVCCISLHPLVSDHSSTTQRTILHLNNYIRQVQQLCLHSVNTLSTYSMHLNRFWERNCLVFWVFFSQNRYILPLSFHLFYFTLVSVSLNLHIISQLLSGCAKEQCTLAGCQGNLLKCSNWPVGLVG